MAKKNQDRSTNPGTGELEKTSAAVEVPRLLTTKQAADVLGMKPETLVMWRCKRRYPLRFLKMGGAVRYTLADLHKFLEAAAVTPAGLRKPRIIRRPGPTRQAKFRTTI